MRHLCGTSLIAFAGIGVPQKFFNFLNKIGCNVIGTIPFADHHIYSKNELFELEEKAKKTKSHLVTTEKDATRLPENFLKKINVLTISIKWKNKSAITKLLARLTIN